MGQRGAGARRGSRRSPRPRRALDPRALAVAGATVAAGLTWGVLVWGAIRFGQSARGGDGSAWALMALASLGAVGCLFAALVLGTRAARMFGLAARPPVRSAVAGSRRGGKRRR